MTTIPPTTPPTSPGLDQAAMSAAADRWATRAKPPGSLGRLEALAVHLAGVTGEVPPAVPQHPALVVFAGDHGVVADGASAWLTVDGPGAYSVSLPEIPGFEPPAAHTVVVAEEPVVLDVELRPVRRD